jgi:hypothetical protein
MCKTKDHKKKRNKNIFNKLRKEELLKTKERNRKQGTYRTGMNMDDDNDLDAARQPTRKKARTTTNAQAVVCKHCGLTGHSRITNTQCLHYKGPQKQPTGTAPTAASLPANVEALDSDDQAEDVDQYEMQQALLLAAAQEPAGTTNPDSHRYDNGKDDDLQVLNVL